MLGDYASLFDSGFQDADSLQSKFTAAFGDSYSMMDPQFLDLMEQVHKEAELSAQSGPDLTRRREICSSEAFFSAMRLDQIVRANSSTRVLQKEQVGESDPRCPRLLLSCRLYHASSQWLRKRKNYRFRTLTAYATASRAWRLASIVRFCICSSLAQVPRGRRRGRQFCVQH
mgnify:CR=1 FL=1